MANEAQDAEHGESKAWPFLMTWTGRVSALIGLFASLAGGVTWLVTHHRHAEELKAKMDLAQAQVQQQDYQAAVASYGEILKGDPSYAPALDAQLNVAELWAENFHALGREGQDPSVVGATELDQLMPVLEAGFARSKGAAAADVQAHIGWAHFLNQKIAEREFGSAAEDNLRAALKTDPKNVYANAMLGNWMLQGQGNLGEAMNYLDTAAATGKVRPWVRGMELGGLRFLDEKGACAAQMRVANDMRKDSEPMDRDQKGDILSFCFSPTMGERSELVGALSAVPADDAWKTYLWLDDSTRDREGQRLTHEFMQANLLELGGDSAGALAIYRHLSQELKNTPFTMIDPVNEAIARLSHR
jgi:Tfp pilus assembly protein PilF